tara:strand:+ start:194 stop:544 length:351 start_codon:yes stop_codon:yes gene_type:complete
MDEKKIQSLLREFAAERDWDKFHTLKNLAISISIEASELLEIFQWDNQNLNIRKNEEVMTRISEEVADILLYLLRFSDMAKLDLEKICLDKINLNKKKYPIKLSKGLSAKYTKLKR